jgi:hypothetical protein
MMISFFLQHIKGVKRDISLDKVIVNLLKNKNKTFFFRKKKLKARLRVKETNKSNFIISHSTKHDKTPQTMKGLRCRLYHLEVIT